MKWFFRVATVCMLIDIDSRTLTYSSVAHHLQQSITVTCMLVVSMTLET